MTAYVRVGVVGLRRGLGLARQSQAVGMQVVAVCDVDPGRLHPAREIPGAVPYGEFDTFLDDNMDAVIVANAFDEHAPLAIQALEAGEHVLSETVSCRSLGEAVRLVRAVERSGLVYQLAENYPFKPHARQMRRLFQAGEIGSLKYAEAEYLHGFHLTTSPVLARRRTTGGGTSRRSPTPRMRSRPSCPSRTCCRSRSVPL
jgi:predicted dehydrogenase